MREGWRKEVLTSGRFQPLCRLVKLVFGYHEGKELLSRWMKEQNKGLYLNVNDFYFIFESNGINLKQVAEEVKKLLKMKLKLFYWSLEQTKWSPIWA